MASSLPPNAQAIAQASLIRLSDLPSGWVQSAAPPTTASFSGNAQFASCLGLASTLVSAAIPSANSPTFTVTPSTASVNERVVVYPSTSESSTFFNAMDAVRAPGCLRKMFQQLTAGSASGSKAGGPSLAPFTATREPLPKYGDGSTEIQLTTSYSGQSGPVNIYITVIVIEKGQLNAFLSLTSSLSPLPVKLRDSLAAAAARRMDRAT